MNRKSLIISVAAMMAAVSACGEKEPQKPTIVQPGGGEDTSIKVGEILPAWQEGEMDIHFINTTTGESAFVIMPDGTQLRRRKFSCQDQFRREHDKHRDPQPMGSDSHRYTRFPDHFAIPEEMHGLDRQQHH